MPDFVEIAFDCVPLSSIGQLRPPLDASAEFRIRCERIAEAIQRHGVRQTYWIENAHCTFHLANSEVVGMTRFAFTGVVATDAGDAKAERVELDVELVAQTCGGVPDGVANWLAGQVHRAMAVEFDRYIAAGKLTMPQGEQPPDDAGL
jgi:hypothetical protein